MLAFWECTSHLHTSKFIISFHHSSFLPIPLELIDKNVLELEVLHDFFFQDDMPLLNFEKMHGLAAHNKIVVHCQKSIQIFNIDDDNQNNKTTQNLLNNLIVLSEEDLQKYSEICEAPELECKQSFHTI